MATEPARRQSLCPCCGSDEYKYLGYGGCSVCRPHEERERACRGDYPPQEKAGISCASGHVVVHRWWLVCALALFWMLGFLTGVRL